MSNSERRPNIPNGSSFELSGNTIKIERRETNLEIAIAVNGVNIPVELVRQEPIPTWHSPLAFGEFTDPQLLAEYVVRTQLALTQPKLRGLRLPDAEAPQQQPNDG